MLCCRQLPLTGASITSYGSSFMSSRNHLSMHACEWGGQCQSIRGNCREVLPLLCDGLLHRVSFTQTNIVNKVVAYAIHHSMHCRRLPWLKAQLCSNWSGNRYRRGVVIAGVTFGSLHFTGGRNWAFAAFASGVGTVYGAAFLATGNVVVPITAHILSNIIAAALYKQFRQPTT